MIIVYEGQSYPFEFDDITVKQALKIEKHTGLSFQDWGKKLGEGGDLKALQAIGWLILEGGRDVPIDDCDFKLVPLGAAFGKAAAAEAEAAKAAEAAKPGPTAAVTSSAPTSNGTGDLSAVSSAAAG